MNHAALTALVPTNKFETEKAAALVALGFPTVEPILSEIVEWMQDLNWPVARVFQPFLVGVGAPLAPHVRTVLAGNDDIWKHWLVFGVVRESSELAHAMRPELERLAHRPTQGEQVEGVAEVASQVLWALRHEPKA